MSKIRHIAVLVLALGLSQLSVTTTPSTATEKPTEPVFDWQRLALHDEEFSVLTPVKPSLLIQSDGHTFSQGGERVLRHRSYSGYEDGFIFVIESYKASRPQRLLKDIDDMFGNLGRVRLEALENVTFGRFQGKKYAIGRDTFAGYTYVFVTAKHVYTIIVAAKDKNHLSFSRFLSSFTLGDTSSVVGSVIPRSEDDSVSSQYSDPVIANREATRKVIVVWKPEPVYTESARSNQRTGTVVLKGIFTPSGQVIILGVIKGLKDGLTEKAIEAAKQIRFFPAEKDGKAVSVTLQLEYNFNLY
jgi:TonB family protein